MSSLWVKFRMPCALMVIFVAGWQILSWIVPRFALSSPGETVATLAYLLIQPWFIGHLSVTLYETVIAYVFVILAGLTGGVALGISPFWGEVAEPYVVSIYSLPKVLLYPLFLIAFTVGAASKIAFGWFHGIFPVVILTRNTVKNINPVYLKMARSFHLSFYQMFREILLPYALPSIVTGLRLGFNLTLLGVVLGELIASSRGLGYLLAARAAEGFIVEEVMAIVLFLFLLALLANGAFGLWERNLTRGERAARYGK